MLEANAHHVFLMLVNAAAMVKDIQTGKFMAASVISNVMDIDASCLDDYADDMPSLSGMVTEYVRWQYGEIDRPAWIIFYNGKYI